jgi:hypothetical protein
MRMMLWFDGGPTAKAWCSDGERNTCFEMSINSILWWLAVRLTGGDRPILKGWHLTGRFGFYVSLLT